MMNAAQLKEKAKAQFGSRGLQSIVVPQWDATIYYKSPNLSTIKAAYAQSKGDSFEMNARIVVACAMDENENRIWNGAEYKDLMVEYDPGAVVMVAKAIMEGVNLMSDPQQQAEDEKN